MPRPKAFKFTTNSPNQTQKLALELASFLSAGDILALTGDLGAGKTCFVQGLARGLSVKKKITSPTFNLIKEYPGRLPLYHFDVYRLKSLDELVDLGYEEYFFSRGITVVEWGEKIRPLFGASYLEINFKRKLKENERQIKLIPRGKYWQKKVVKLVKKWPF